MIKQIQIPALTTLNSSDATAIRQIVNVLVQEIVDLNNTIGAMQSDINSMRRRQPEYTGRGRR